MTIFEIHDSAKDLIVGYVFYFERAKRFYAEVPSDLDEWTAPFMFYGHVKRGIYSIDDEWTMKWVRQRIIPAERQNIGAILRDNGLKYYDEYKLLCLSEGRCAQDELYIVRTELEKLPDEIKQRLAKKVRDVLPLPGNRVVVFFKDGEARLIAMDDLLADQNVFLKILREPEVFNRVHVSPGGNGIEWGVGRAVTAEKLYVSGEKSQLSYDDMLRFAALRLVDTTDACKYLDVSRQYINQLIKQERITPVITGEKSRILSRAELEAEP